MATPFVTEHHLSLQLIQSSDEKEIEEKAEMYKQFGWEKYPTKEILSIESRIIFCVMLYRIT